MLKVAFHHTFIEIRQLRASARNPVHESVEQVEGSPCAVASEPVLDAARRVKLDDLSMGTALQAPDQPAPAQLIFCCRHPLSAVESADKGPTMPSRLHATHHEC
jgi:hypothetical protein